MMSLVVEHTHSLICFGSVCLFIVFILHNVIFQQYNSFTFYVVFSALTLSVGQQQGNPPCKKWGDGGGGHWLVQMDWRPAGWSVCLPLLIFPCTIKSRSSLLALAHPGGPRKRAVKELWCGGGTLVLHRPIIKVTIRIISIRHRFGIHLCSMQIPSSILILNDPHIKVTLPLSASVRYLF